MCESLSNRSCSLVGFGMKNTTFIPSKIEETMMLKGYKEELATKASLCMVGKVCTDPLLGNKPLAAVSDLG